MFQVLRQDENALSLVFITLILSDKQQKGELTFVINAQRKTVIYNLWSYMTVFDMIRCTHRAVCRFFSMAVLRIMPYRDDTICQDCSCTCHVDVREVLSSARRNTRPSGKRWCQTMHAAPYSMQDHIPPLSRLALQRSPHTRKSSGLPMWRTRDNVGAYLLSWSWRPSS